MPIPNSYDDVRGQWENAILPHYSETILFASLSVAERGLRNYGGADIVLADFALQDRATVFEGNGLDFAGRHKLDEIIPPGYRATWQERAKVAIAKLYIRLPIRVTPHQIDELMQVDAGGGANDDFVEVHVFGGVNRETFAKVLAKPKGKIDQQSWKVSKLLAAKAGIPVVTRR